MNYYCKHCGTKYPSIRQLTSSNCHHHPDGKGKHELYEGSEKSSYQCKFCGSSYRTLYDLTAQNCHRHPNGKGRHSPAL